MNMVLKRGSQEYRVQNVTHVADDRYVGMIGRKVAGPLQSDDFEADSARGLTPALNGRGLSRRNRLQPVMPAIGTGQCLPEDVSRIRCKRPKFRHLGSQGQGGP